MDIHVAVAGVDSVFSMEPEKMEQLVIESGRAWQDLGQLNCGPTKLERTSLVFRHSLYVAQFGVPGDVFTPDNLKAVWPGLGLSPKYYDLPLGKSVKKAVSRGTPVSWELL